MILGLRSTIRRLEKLTRKEVDGEEFYSWAVGFVWEHHPDYSESWVEVNARRILQTYRSVRQAVEGERRRKEEIEAWRKEAVKTIEAAIVRHGGPEALQRLRRIDKFFKDPLDRLREIIRLDQERN